MDRRQAIVGLISAGLAGNAAASGLELVPEARRVGSGRLSVLFIPIFDATLFAPRGEWRADRPFALELAYLISIRASDIVRRSVDEMTNQGFSDQLRMEKWEAQMREIFPDVHNGLSLTGVRSEQGQMRLYDDQRLLGGIDDPDFTTAFFNIWLGPRTSQPGLRRDLLGL